jgi:outer membrane cobalamin receptor
LTKNAVFTEAVKQEFDSLCKIYGRLLQHQSDRQYDRAYFCSGITSNAQKRGHEQTTVVLLCLIIFVSKHGAQFDMAFDGIETKAQDGVGK